ncbi:hypothetical protein B7R22_04070 [Subtercola boreus]|uniref:FAD/NAD(P)-binding oxidoreductase n=1 Tax=Subtercola boreus TaxID=120213 RepID=A0A3E0W3V2_9MICO|nr:FAD-dependent oxidoreductase [Subtercola boreus]RFA16651.1 hypothetical protein B7R22_04070 [Subtercola boreus]
MTAQPLRSAQPLRVVLVGYGPVGARFVEGLLDTVEGGTVALTVVGAETDDAYNRVLLAEFAVGRSTRDRLETTDTAAARVAGVSIRLGEAAVGLDRVRQTVRLDTGDLLPYDRLVFATGARANIPTLEGLERSRRSRLEVSPSAERMDRGTAPLPDGVIALRDLRDAAALRTAIESRARLVVLGAGVLGIELALAAAEQGAEVVAVYHGDIPMARNLDTGGGRVLASAARRAGVVMAPHSRAESVLLRHDNTGRAHFDALVCADGKQIGGDLLVLSCGVSARTELAAAAQLTVSAGIVVDSMLRSWDDVNVFAIGDCAHIVERTDGDAARRGPGERPSSERAPAARIFGAPSGLIGPGWRQADWLAASLVREATTLAGPAAAAGAADAAAATSAALPSVLAAERPSVVMLKAEGVDIVSGGDYSADLWDDAHEVTQWADPARGSYVKLVTEGGVLTGFVSAGCPRLGAELTLLFESRGELPADRSSLLHLDGTGAAESVGSDPLAPHATVCWCNGVTVGRITEVVAEGQRTVECVGKATRAGTGCGGCKGRIAEIIALAAPVAAI